MIKLQLVTINKELVTTNHNKYIFGHIGSPQTNLHTRQTNNTIHHQSPIIITFTSKCFVSFILNCFVLILVETRLASNEGKPGTSMKKRSKFQLVFPWKDFPSWDLFNIEINSKCIHGCWLLFLFSITRYSCSNQNMYSLQVLFNKKNYIVL